MKDAERKHIISILESGEMPSSEWSAILFPNQKRECELVYDGKAREEDILAETMSVPLQQTRLFGNNGNGWHNKLIFGDNLQIMKSLLDDKKSGKLCNADGTPGIRLVYIDPPFSTKKEMQGIGGAQAYQDKLVAGEFLEFLRKRLILIRELLSDDGSVYVHLDWRMSAYVRVLMDEVFGKNNFVNESIWQGAIGDTSAKNKKFIKSHETIFFYRKDKVKPLWNDIFQKYSEASERLYRHSDAKGRYRVGPVDNPGGGGYIYDLGYGEKVPSGGYRMPKETALRWIECGELLIEKGRVPGRKLYMSEGVRCRDVWMDIRATQGGEYLKYPTQKPEALIDRIIKASSNEGDLVADFFCGSGTTVAVAEKLERRWIGSDCGKLAIYTTQKRMLNLRKEIGSKGASLNPQPFALLNAGLYELEKLSEESGENWNRFVLQLFQCREIPHKIGGIQMHGKLRGKSVLVYNPQDLKKGGSITEETIQEIHSSVEKLIGGQMFVVAPAMSFGFFQDYIDCGNVRYYALRIPYSIINELHQRDFTALRQPENENAINETVEAVGFDFNRCPKLEYSVGVERASKHFFIKIKTFKSDARIPEALKVDKNRGTLSMVMLDYDYRKKVFEFDDVFYSDGLQKNKWTLSFPSDKVGENVMAIFIDIYGNEARELINVKDFKKKQVVVKKKKRK